MVRLELASERRAASLELIRIPFETPRVDGSEIGEAAGIGYTHLLLERVDGSKSSARRFGPIKSPLQT